MTEEEKKLDWNFIPRDIEPYKKALYTNLKFVGIHSETAKGYVVYVSQWKKVFYKPRNSENSIKGFFALNTYLKTGGDNSALANLIREIHFDGFVIDKYPAKEIRALQFVKKEYIEKVQEKPNLIGHIKAIKQLTPFYPEQRPLVTSIGNFYYKTEYNYKFVPDEDTTELFKRDEDIAIEVASTEQTIDVLSQPVEFEMEIV